MNPIQEALQSGYSPEDVFAFVQKAFPKLSPKIKKASSLGYTIPTILQFLSKSMEGSEYNPGINQSEARSIQKRKDDAISKGLFKMGGSIFATSMAFPRIAQGIRSAFQPTPTPPSIPPVATTLLSSPENAAKLSKQPNIPEQTEIKTAQPEAEKKEIPTSVNIPTISHENILKEMGIETQVKNLSEAGNSPETIATAIHHSLKPHQKKYLEDKIKKGELPPLQTSIEKYLKSLSQTEKQKIVPETPQEKVTPQLEKTNVVLTPEEWRKKSQGEEISPPKKMERVKNIHTGKEYEVEPSKEEGKVDLVDEKGQRTPFPEKVFDKHFEKVSEKKEGYKEWLDRRESEGWVKNELVSTPNGTIGNIESVRDKEALVKDENGKLHKVKVDDLISSPLPEKDMSELYDDLIKGIEKHTGQDVSRHVSLAGYDPKFNQLAYHPHGGGIYIFGNISEEDKKELTSLLHQRKSTGENFIGGWEEGTTSPIGAAMSKLIKKLTKEHGGKGKEYLQKFETFYNYLEPAIKLAKQKKKEKK